VDFTQVVRTRKMTRAFTTEPLDPAVVARILDTANRGPSAGFSQGYALLVLQAAEDLEPFWALTSDPGESAGTRARQEKVSRAPLVVVPLSCKDIYLDRYARADKGWADRDEARWPVPYWDIDTGFMALLMLLAAVDEGLGALFFGIEPDRFAAFRAQYGVPQAYTPIGAVAIGHPDRAADPGGSSRVIRRRPLDDLAHYGRW
jgi:nitroreductase